MKLLTFARNLKRRKAREREQLFVAEGVRAVEELLASPLSVRGILITPELQETARGAELLDRIMDLRQPRDYGVAQVAKDDFAEAADTESPQGVLAIAEIPKRSFENGTASKSPYRALVLDGLQDPGNVGTILRTAAALGVDETISLTGTVDLWNAKVVRGSMGAHFRHRAFSASPEALHEYLAQHNVPLWVADAGGDIIEDAIRTGVGTPGDRLALAVGNEGAGLSFAVTAKAARTIALPIQNIESLNVAVATGILLYMLRTPTQS